MRPGPPGWCPLEYTDRFQLIAGSPRDHVHSRGAVLVEIFPAEITGQEVAVYEHQSLELACAMFEALHLYRDLAVKPFLIQANEMI